MQDKRVNKPLLVVIIVLLLLVAAGCIALIVMYMGSGSPDLSQYQTANTTSAVTQTTVSSPTVQPTEPTQPLPDNPIDFASLQATNSDIYAWIRIPGTNVDYPVACATDQADGFYLDHNIYKQYEFAGTIYSEKQNGMELASRNTVLYGHNMLNGTMFRTLHNFENEEFFNNTLEFYVYTPGHIYTYTVFAAYEYDNRHILNSFDFSDDTVWADYLEYIQNPRSMNVHTREVELTLDDRIMTLSTCVGTNHNARYLVQGVLTSDQPTK